MLPYIIPAMDAASDSDAIQSAIRQAVESGCNRVLIPKKKTSRGFTHWEIDRAILLPSNITILLDDCHLRLKDGVYENMFRHIFADTPDRRCLHHPDFPLEIQA